VYDGLILCWCCCVPGWWVLWCISDCMTCRLVTLAKVYCGLRSLTFSSSISGFCWLKLFTTKTHETNKNMGMYLHETSCNRKIVTEKLILRSLCKVSQFDRSALNMNSVQKMCSVGELWVLWSAVQYQASYRGMIISFRIYELGAG
jgi:hypothetical protein